MVQMVQGQKECKKGNHKGIAKLTKLQRHKVRGKIKFQGMPERLVKNQDQQRQKQAKAKQKDGKKAYFGNLRGQDSTKFDENL